MLNLGSINSSAIGAARLQRVTAQSVVEGMSESSFPYRWSDAWVFLAVALAGNGDWVALDAIVAAGDGIEHAILSREELDGGLNRLTRGGLVEVEHKRCRLAASGLVVYQHVSAAHRQLGKLLTAVQEQIGAAPWRRDDVPPAVARDPDLPELVSQAAYEVAVRSYLGRGSRRISVRTPRRDG
jgi:hypothetical protein